MNYRIEQKQPFTIVGVKQRFSNVEGLGEIVGPMPNAMAEVWGKIFSEWFPKSEYKHANAPEVEWYSDGDMSSSEYKSEIWIPIVKK